MTITPVSNNEQPTMPILQNVKNGFIKTAEIAGVCASSTDAMGRTIKPLIFLTEFIQTALGFVPGTEGVRSGLGLLKGQLKGADSVIKATNIFERGKEWVNPEDRAGILKSWQKTASRINLTVAQGLETVSFVDKVTLGFFGRTALCVGGGLPIFEIVKNFFVLVASIFGIWHAGKELSRANGEIKLAVLKTKKWTDRENHLVGVNDREAIMRKYRLRIASEYVRKEGVRSEKMGRWNKYQQVLNNKSADYSTQVKNFQKIKQDRIREKLNLKLLNTGTTSANLREQGEERKKIIQGKDADLKKLYCWDSEARKLRNEIGEMTKAYAGIDKQYKKVKRLEDSIKLIDAGKVEKLIDHKVEKYETKEYNGNVDRRKNWVSIAADIAKIAGVVLGMFSVAFSLTFPWLSLPTAVLLLSAFGIFSYSVGLGKILLDKVGPQIKKMDRFETVPAA